MNKPTVLHGSFTVEREYGAPIERVFAAWTTAEAKIGWFAQGDDFIDTLDEYTLDFRVGGKERLVARLANGHRLVLEGTFHDIVDDSRIVGTYEIVLNERRISVSLYSVQLFSTTLGTRLTTSEDGAFLDEADDPAQRRLGVESDLDQLAHYLGRAEPAMTRG